MLAYIILNVQHIGNLMKIYCALQGDRITFDQQLKNHEMTVSSIREILGEPGLASQYLKKCLYHVGFGSNDYLNNYFIPAVYETSSMFTVEKFTQVLIQQYRRQILVSSYICLRSCYLFSWFWQHIPTP